MGVEMTSFMVHADHIIHIKLYYQLLKNIYSVPDNF